MLSDCEFVRVVTKDNEECFILTKLKDRGQDGFDLTLCHDGTVWTGEVSGSELDKLRSRLKMDLKTYVRQTVQALTSIGDTKDSFQYQLKRQGDNAEFLWKKHVPAEDITFQLGQASLKTRPDSSVLITKIFNHCIESMQDLKERIRTLETDNERLSQERINALKRLEKCVVAKEELENDMYSKFSLVLNSKKEKIRQLKLQVQEGVSVGNCSSGPSDVPAKSSTVKRSRTPDPTHSDSEENTDDETKSKRQRSGPAKKSVVPDSMADLSLDLGGDEGTIPVTSSRPARQRGRGQKKQTPAKPVLPRVGSNESSVGDTPGSERKMRLRKGGSGSSSRSSENVDADDLMGQL